MKIIENHRRYSDKKYSLSFVMNVDTLYDFLVFVSENVNKYLEAEVYMQDSEGEWTPQGIFRYDGVCFMSNSLDDCMSPHLLEDVVIDENNGRFDIQIFLKR